MASEGRYQVSDENALGEELSAGGFAFDGVVESPKDLLSPIAPGLWNLSGPLNVNFSTLFPNPDFARLERHD
jgi:hypothetical protein